MADLVNELELVQTEIFDILAEMISDYWLYEIDWEANEERTIQKKLPPIIDILGGGAVLYIESAADYTPISSNSLRPLDYE